MAVFSRMPASRPGFGGLDRRGLWILAIVGVGYGATLTTYFSNDDFVWIRDTRLGSPLDLPALTVIKTTLGEFFFRPLVNLSFGIDGLLWFAWPPGYHLTNIALHAFVSWSLYELVVTVDGRRDVALAAAVIFVLRPTHANAVTWISGRTELLAAAGVIFALVHHLGRKRRDAWIAALFFALGLLSKENAIVFVPLAAGAGLIAGAPLRARRYLAYLFLAAVYVAVRSRAVHHLGAGIVGIDPALAMTPGAFADFIWQKIQALGALLVSPMPLPPIAAGVLLVAAFAAWALVFSIGSMRRHVAAISLAGLLTFVPLAPHLFFWFTQARYVYLPSAGVSVAAASALHALARGLEPRSTRSSVVFWTLVLGCALAGGMTLRRENRVLWEAGEVADRFLADTRRLVPSPPAGSVLHYFDLGLLRRAPPAARPFVFGLEAGVQVALGDFTLQVDTSGDPAHLDQSLSAPGKRYSLRVADVNGALAPGPEPRGAGVR